MASLEDVLSQCSTRGGAALAVRSMWRFCPLVDFLDKRIGTNRNLGRVNLAESCAAAFSIGVEQTFASSISDDDVRQARDWLERRPAGELEELSRRNNNVAVAELAARAIQDLETFVRDIINGGSKEPQLVRNRCLKIAAACFKAVASASALDSNIWENVGKVSRVWRESELGKIEETVVNEVKRVAELCPVRPEQTGRPLDPSESGPLGELWPGFIPAWFAEGNLLTSSLQKTPEPKINFPDLEWRPQSGDNRADFIIWKCKDNGRDVERVVGQIKQIHETFPKSASPVLILALDAPNQWFEALLRKRTKDFKLPIRFLRSSRDDRRSAGEKIAEFRIEMIRQAAPSLRVIRSKPFVAADTEADSEQGDEMPTGDAPTEDIIPDNAAEAFKKWLDFLSYPKD